MFASNNTSKMNKFCRFTFISIRQQYLIDCLTRCCSSAVRLLELRNPYYVESRERWDVMWEPVSWGAPLSWLRRCHISPHVLRVRGASSQCQGAALYTVGLHHFCKHSTPLIEFLIGVGTRTWAVPVPPVGNCGESIYVLWWLWRGGMFYRGRVRRCM